jgi:two-component system cell cycle sensor histidine kinase/response regulator CckA
MQAFSRPRETRREALQLRGMVDEVLKLMRVKLPPHVDLCVRTGLGLPPIAADPSQIQPLLVSIISNAVDAIGDERGAIEIHVELAPASDAGPNAELVPGDYIVLSVRDTGCGMTPATLERIFDPFFTTKLPGQGTGLGLSVAHRVMRNHAGAITVSSEPGRGSVFRLYFPTAAVAEVPLPEITPQLLPRSRGERILVVDDEPTLVRLVSRMLSRVGYQVVGHDDANAALAAFRASPHAFDAVVTDLSMPAMSGFELVTALRALRPDVPVLMTSGDLDDDARSRADLAGIQELIPKPNTVGMLVAALDRVFQ